MILNILACSPTDICPVAGDSESANVRAVPGAAVVKLISSVTVPILPEGSLEEGLK
ncbi:MAG: hypothetical protein ACD_59C00125G0001 [uncultured bacterium]|nr:MAG: hypothetical protein ACD_59C00125G0001 [uncultured bacterium]